jgi:hypothetical protein
MLFVAGESEVKQNLKSEEIGGLPQTTRWLGISCLNTSPP